MGKSTINGQFSIVMSVYQRVPTMTWGSEAKPYDLFRAYAQSLGAGAPQMAWQFEILEIVL